MKKAMLVALLLFPTSTSGQEPSNGIDAGALLAQAVERVKPCSYISVREDLDDQHRVVKRTEETPKGDGSPVSLGLLLKPDRYELKLEEPFGRIDLHHKEAGQLATEPGESRVYNWAMNKLDGHVMVDTDSGDLKSVDVSLPKEDGNALGKFFEFKFHLEQERAKESYVLRQMTMETWFKYRDWKKFFFRNHEEHFKLTTNFSCQ